MSRDIAWPRNPTRKEILETLNDEGLKYWRNPVHLRAISGTWPMPQTEEAKNDHKIMKHEMHPSFRNGSIPK